MLGVSHRDLNPGNFIVRDDGSLVLIDFDQAVADAPEFRGADLDGSTGNRAKNDFESLLERAGLIRRANDLISQLAGCWPSSDAAFELEIAAHRFPGRLRWADLWHPIVEEIGALAGLRVLDWHSSMPLFAFFAASHGARVSVAAPDADAAALLHQLSPMVGGLQELGSALPASAAADFDLVVCLSPPDAQLAVDALVASGASRWVLAGCGGTSALLDGHGVQASVRCIAPTRFEW